MSKASAKRWKHTSPLAAIFYLGRIVDAIAKNAVQTFVPLAAYLATSEGPLFTRIIIATATFFVIIIAASIVRYWFFRYRITDDSVLIREGVFKKTQLDIKFDRIQAINTQQNVIYRYFDLVTVKFDTAGSAKQEGNLPAIKTSLADSLKERIRRDRPAVVTADGEEEAPPDIRPLLTLDNADMVRIGLSNNRALIFLALLGPLMERIGEQVEAQVEAGAFTLITGGAEVTLVTGTLIGAAVGVGIILLLMIASIIGAFLRYHRYSLVADDDVLRSTGGLLTRHEHSTNLAKIQTFEARQNPVLRLFKRFRLRAKQASSGKPGRSKHFVVPLCDRTQLPTLADEVFREEFPGIDMLPDSEDFQPISIRYFRSRLILVGVLPALLASGLGYLLAGPVGLVLLAWIPLVAVVVWMMYKKRGYRLSEYGLVLRRGFIGIRTNAFLHRKVQRISITQTIIQKRKGLATVRFYLASGSLKMPYVDFELAKTLRDFVLYRVESSKLAWH
ncbi:MAG: PH domain-containing protein [Woeseiaceae bacterium]